MGEANGRYTTGLWTRELREARDLVRRVLASAIPTNDD